MKIECDIEQGGIIVMKFPSQYHLTSTLLRPQEFYESPYEHINGQYFEYETYMDTYYEDTGVFDYFEEWNGFNLPSHTLRRFEAFFLKHQMTKKENIFFDTLTKIKSDWRFCDDKFYVIAICDDDDETLKHEKAHAYFYLSEGYKKLQLSNLAKMNQEHLEVLKHGIREMGYGENVVLDECQAYLATSPLEYLQRKVLKSPFLDFEIPRSVVDAYHDMVVTMKNI